MNDELAQLIAEQEIDMRRGHRVYPRSGTVSLDAMYYQSELGLGTRDPIWKPPVFRRQRLSPDDHRHGTMNGYHNYRCRCGRCRAANAAAQRDYQRRRRNRDLHQ